MLKIKNKKAFKLNNIDKSYIQTLENIKFYRNKLNLTQEEIAEKIDAERSYITALECGNKSPSIYFLYELAKALNIPLKELLDINID